MAPASARLLAFTALLCPVLLIAAPSGCDNSDDDVDNRCRPLDIWVDSSDFLYLCDCNGENCDPVYCDQESDCDEHSAYCDDSFRQCRAPILCFDPEDCAPDLTCDPYRDICTDGGP